MTLRKQLSYPITESKLTAVDKKHETKRNCSDRGNFSKKEASDVRFEGVCGPDSHGQAPMDGFMASLKANI